MNLPRVVAVSVDSNHAFSERCVEAIRLMLPEPPHRALVPA